MALPDRRSSPESSARRRSVPPAGCVIASPSLASFLTVQRTGAAPDPSRGLRNAVSWRIQLGPLSVRKRATGQPAARQHRTRRQRPDLAPRNLRAARRVGGDELHSVRCLAAAPAPCGSWREEPDAFEVDRRGPHPARRSSPESPARRRFAPPAGCVIASLMLACDLTVRHRRGPSSLRWRHGEAIAGAIDRGPCFRVTGLPAVRRLRSTIHR